MGQNIVGGIVAVITTVIVVAIVAVLVSKNSQTGQVLTSGGTALAGVLNAALSPVNSAASTQLGQTGTILNPLG